MERSTPNLIQCAVDAVHDLSTTKRRPVHNVDIQLQRLDDVSLDLIQTSGVKREKDERPQELEEWVT